MFLYEFADQAVILFLKWRGSARLVLMTGLYKNRGQFSNDSFCLRVQQVRILLERKNSSSCFHISSIATLLSSIVRKTLSCETTSTLPQVCSHVQRYKPLLYMTYFMFLYEFADQAVILFLKWRGSARLVLMTGLYKNRGQFSNDSFCLRVQQVRILLERKNSSSCFHISIFYFVPRITIVSVTKCSNMICC